MLRLCWMFCAIVSVTKAGDDGWSVIVMLFALERALIRDGRAVPVFKYVSGGSSDGSGAGGSGLDVQIQIRRAYNVHSFRECGL